MAIYIEKLKKSDALHLLDFECVNRRFFEEMIPTRGDEYYVPEIFNKKLAALLDEQFQGVSQFYLIKDQDQKILGRINLVDFDKSREVCHLGYRIGEAHTRQGIASRSLSLLLQSLKDTDISLIKAKTTTNNIASQKVLEKNGFVKVKTSAERFELNDERVNFINYELTNAE